jgi:hypothetical protein
MEHANTDYQGGKDFSTNSQGQEALPHNCVE